MQLLKMRPFNQTPQKAAIADLQKKVSALQDSIKVKDKALAAAEIKANNSNTNMAASKELTELKTKLAAAQENIKKLTADNKALNNKANMASKGAGANQEQVKLLEAENAALKDKMKNFDAMKEQNGDLSKLVGDKDAEIKKNNNIINELRSLIKGEGKIYTSLSEIVKSKVQIDNYNNNISRDWVEVVNAQKAWGSTYFPESNYFRNLLAGSKPDIIGIRDNLDLMLDIMKQLTEKRIESVEGKALLLNETRFNEAVIEGQNIIVLWRELEATFNKKRAFLKNNNFTTPDLSLVFGDQKFTSHYVDTLVSNLKLRIAYENISAELKGLINKYAKESAESKDLLDRAELRKLKLQELLDTAEERKLTDINKLRELLTARAGDVSFYKAQMKKLNDEINLNDSIIAKLMKQKEKVLQQNADLDIMNKKMADKMARTDESLKLISALFHNLEKLGHMDDLSNVKGSDYSDFLKSMINKNHEGKSGSAVDVTFEDKQTLPSIDNNSILEFEKSNSNK